MTLGLPIDIGAPAEQTSVVPFQTIVADPPWQPRDALPGPKRGASKHYRTMPTRDICALAYRLPLISNDALLFCWRLSSMPFDGLEVCRAWGFEPVSEIVWVKTPSVDLDAVIRKVIRQNPLGLDSQKQSANEMLERLMGGAMVWLEGVARRSFDEARRVRIMLGHYVRLSHEVCTIAARKGAASRIKAHDVPSVFFAPVGEHSAKPAAFYEIVERLAPGPYLELFARAPRGPEWTAIGDALGTTLDLPLAPSEVRS